MKERKRPISENKDQAYHRISKDLGACFPSTMPTKVSGCSYLPPLRPRATLNPDEEARNSTGDSHFHFNSTSVTVQHNLYDSTLQRGCTLSSVKLKGKKVGDKLSRALKR